MIKLLSLYQVSRGPSHKRLRAKIQHEGKVKSVWCGKQISSTEHISAIDSLEKYIKVSTSSEAGQTEKSYQT